MGGYTAACLCLRQSGALHKARMGWSLQTEWGLCMGTAPGMSRGHHLHAEKQTSLHLPARAKHVLDSMHSALFKLSLVQLYPKIETS